MDFLAIDVPEMVEYGEHHDPAFDTGVKVLEAEYYVDVKFIHPWAL